MKKIVLTVLMIMGLLVVAGCARIEGLDQQKEEAQATTTRIRTTAAPTTTEAPATTKAAVNDAVEFKYIRVKADALNVRSIGSMEGTILTKVYDGQIYEVLDGRKDKDGLLWYKLEAPGDIVGWVSSDYCVGGESQESLKLNE